MGVATIRVLSYGFCKKDSGGVGGIKNVGKMFGLFRISK
jgi:hypothetical protein